MTKGIESARMPNALRVAVKEALVEGWTAKRGSNGWKLRSPGGTQWMHITPGTNIPDDQARTLRKKMAQAAIEEAGPEFLDALDDATDAGATVTCRHCQVEFMTLDGYEGHKRGCRKAREASLAALREAERVIFQPEAPEPSEERTDPLPGYTKSARMPVPSHRPELPMSPTSGKIDIKEEVVTEAATPSRGGYSWNNVKPGLARAIYTAMMQRSRHKGEATSTYANVIASIIEESGFDFGESPILSDAQKKLDAITGILGVDTEALAAAEFAAAENERLQENLKSLKDLIAGL